MVKDASKGGANSIIRDGRGNFLPYRTRIKGLYLLILFPNFPVST